MCRGFTGLFWRFRTLKHWKTTDTLKPTFANSIAVWNPVGTSRFGKATYTRTEGCNWIQIAATVLKPTFYIPFLLSPFYSKRFHRVFVVFFDGALYANFPDKKRRKKKRKMIRKLKILFEMFHKYFRPPPKQPSPFFAAKRPHKTVFMCAANCRALFIRFFSPQKCGMHFFPISASLIVSSGSSRRRRPLPRPTSDRIQPPSTPVGAFCPGFAS